MSLGGIAIAIGAMIDAAIVMVENLHKHMERNDADGKPNVVEVNPLPGILPNPADNSCFPKAARAAGISYNELIQSCLQHAATRQGVALDESRGRARAA